MSISATQHQTKTANPLATLLSSQVQSSTRKPDHDADDLPAAKPIEAAKPQLATSGPGQVLDRKV